MITAKRTILSCLGQCCHLSQGSIVASVQHITDDGGWQIGQTGTHITDQYGHAPHHKYATMRCHIAHSGRRTTPNQYRK